MGRPLAGIEGNSEIPTFRLVWIIGSHEVKFNYEFQKWIDQLGKNGESF